MNTLLLYATTYLIVDALCIVLAVVVMRRVGESFGSEHEIRHFKRMIGFFLLFCATDALWMPINCALLPPNTVANGLLSTINMFATSLIAYHWFCYAQAKMLSRDMGLRGTRVLSLVPIAVLVVLYATNPLTHCMFDFTESGSFAPGPLYGIAKLVGSFYILVVACQAVHKMNASSSKAVRDECATFVSFAVIPALASLVDALFANTPVLAAGILTAILFVFSNLQDARIFNDALTGLNNRRRADLYLRDQIASAASDRTVYVYVVDVNLFKHINDTWGHVEGDHALRVVATSLKRAAGTVGGFAARWGGDEFVLVADSKGVDAPEEVVELVGRDLQESIAREKIEYDLSVSVAMPCAPLPARVPRSCLPRQTRCSTSASALRMRGPLRSVRGEKPQQKRSPALQCRSVGLRFSHKEAKATSWPCLGWQRRQSWRR